MVNWAKISILGGRGPPMWENSHISFGKCLLNRSNQSILRCYIRLWCHFPSHKSNVRCREIFSIVGNKGCCFSPHIFPIVFDKKNVFYIEESFSRHACMARVFYLLGEKLSCVSLFPGKPFSPQHDFHHDLLKKTNKTFSDQLQKQCWKNLVVVTFRCETCADEIFNWICKMQAKWLKASL